MVNIISNWAEIAGLAGIALAVFLLLFKRIPLPKGSRNHLTMYMLMIWSLCLIIIIFYFYNQNHSKGHAELSQHQNMPIWNKDFISISGHGDNTQFINFLKNNNGKIIHLSSALDMSITGIENFEERNLSYIGVWEEVSNEPNYKNPSYEGIDRFIEDSSLSLPLDTSSSLNLNFLKFNFLNNRKLPITQGGTGIHIFPIDSYFKIQILGRSGSSTIYELTEVQQNLNITVR